MTDRSDKEVTVLIIDDARASREALVTMVEGLGYRAITANSGLEGLRLVKEAQPSLVLLDVVMPSFDGYKIAAAIKAQPRFVPVMLLTALNDLESKRRGQAAGADDFLSKPPVPLELQIRIAAMLRIKSLTDALDEANKRLSELADTDGLTGVANRRRLEQLIASEHERAQRYKRPMSMLVLDIDHFKKVNDTYGHSTGDVALKAVARAVAATLRQSDHMGRYGGEEFVVLAPEVPPGGAQTFGERLRKRVEEVVIPLENEQTLKVTVSIGVVAWDGTGKLDAATLFKEADEALYRAKEGGRNRVVLVTLPKPDAPAAGE